MSKTRIDRIRDDIKLANERSPGFSLIGNADKLSKLQDKLINEDLLWALQRIEDMRRMLDIEMGFDRADQPKTLSTPGIQTWYEEMKK